MSDAKNTIAYMEGQLAYNKGDGWYDCKYEKGSTDRQDWQLGYQSRYIQQENAHEHKRSK